MTKMSIRMIVLGAACVLAAAAQAAVAAPVPTRDAMTVARAMTVDDTLLTGATFLTLPPRGNPTGIETRSATLFPRAGASYAVLSTGDVRATFAKPTGNVSDDNAGGAVRGNTDADVIIMRLDLNIPGGVNCMTFDVRFLSEEFPEFPGKTYNDTFIAELDVSDWTTVSSRIIAPHDFSFRENGVPLNIRTAGRTSADRQNARGTAFDGATPLLIASTPVKPGPHSLYLSLFDQGDRLFDTAVFVDRLRTYRLRNPNRLCRLGAFAAIKPQIRLLPNRKRADGRTEFRARMLSESSLDLYNVRLDGKLVVNKPTVDDNLRSRLVRVPLDLDALDRGRHRLVFTARNQAGMTRVVRTFRTR